VQEKWVPHYDAVYDRVGNILLTRLMGADSRLVEDGFDIGIRQSWEDAIESVKAAGGKPYAIPAGASVHKYGALGYVGFAARISVRRVAATGRQLSTNKILHRIVNSINREYILSLTADRLASATYPRYIEYREHILSIENTFYR
jgi:1-aminocyclopropane-1-carboxylate deaminase/D-cysteine desulfhydrase-like pyridoxal-dependent ACC family enzyme